MTACSAHPDGPCPNPATVTTTGTVQVALCHACSTQVAHDAPDIAQAPLGGHMKQWRIELDGIDVISTNRRSHWSKLRAARKVIKQQVCWLAKAERIPPITYAQVHVLATPPDRRRRDEDNLVSGLHKPCLDGLVAAGVLADDSPGHVTSLMPTLREPDGLRRWRAVVIVREVMEDARG
jgi:hypothetical protein